MSGLGERRDKAAFSNGCKPTRRPLQPEATGAAMEVTKWLKPCSHRRAGMGACFLMTTHARLRRSPIRASNSARLTVTVRPSGRGTAPPAASTAATRSHFAIRYASTSDSISRMREPPLLARRSGLPAAAQASLLFLRALEPVWSLGGGRRRRNSFRRVGRAALRKTVDA
jgi:hypothetical protein